jgi:predicted enzyme related to lactoylglutathione lyase
MSEHHGKIHWNELMTSDPEKSKAFWSAVAGWTFEPMPMGEGMTYTIIKSGAEMRGGMMKREPHMGPMDGWMMYVAVDDVDKAAKTTAAKGGKVLNGPFDVPGVGRIAIIADATGAAVGIMTPAPQPG